MGGQGKRWGSNSLTIIYVYIYVYIHIHILGLHVHFFSQEWMARRPKRSQKLARPGAASGLGEMISFLPLGRTNWRWVKNGKHDMTFMIVYVLFYDFPFVFYEINALQPWVWD